MILFRHPASLLRRSEPLQTALIAAAFWTLAVIALTNLRLLYLGGTPQVEEVVAWATMACCILLLGLVGARCAMAWRKSGSLAPIRRTLGGTPGMLLFGAAASYLAIGASVLGMEANREPDTAGLWKYHVLLLGVFAAAVVGGRAVLERTGAERLLQGVLVVLIASCAVILASPVLRDLGILRPYRIPFRLNGAFFDPNDAGLAACMTVALAGALLTNGGPRTLGWLGLAAGAAASLATASRTALVLLGVLAVVFLSINVRSKPSSFLLAWAATGLVGIAAFASFVPFWGGFYEWAMLRFNFDPKVAQEERLFCDPSPTGNPGADCAVLLATRDILAGDMALNWSRALPMHRWRGVTTEGPEGRVTRLNLAGLGLNGRIPSDLGRLDGLVSLSLRRNRLTGPIPPELGDLASLKHLNLSYNALTGGIPPDLAKLENLEELWLKYNRLTGAVPAALGDLELSTLHLSGNDFDSVPSELTDIAKSDLFNTRLCAPLPPTSPALFDDCTVLLAMKETLAGDASLNWHAEIPVGLWQGVTLGGPQERVAKLVLYRKGLNGRIPPELGRLDGLVNLNLAANRLTGPIPPELGSLVALRELSLDRNALTGTAPAELGQLGRLESLWLRGNRLSALFPPELFDIPTHDYGHLLLCAPASRLSPPLFNDCTVLLAVKETLAGEAELNWTATLPISEWQGVTLGGSPIRVTGLAMSKGLTGRIPLELGRLDGLVNLNLAVNRLTGPIPPELGRLVNLRALSLDRNALTGTVPEELGQLSRLESVWLRGNRLSRPFPPKLLEIPAQDLGHLLFCAPASRLSPPLFDDCTVLLAVKEMLAGEVELDWSATLPIGKWQGVTLGGPEGRVIALELPRMGLNGRVPAALGHLAGLRSLVLDGNLLTGAIPPELGKLTDLERLGLAANALTGPIPPELARLSSLRELWLSGNHLTGPLPPERHSVAGGEAPCPAAPALNPGLRADCALLLASRDVLAGDVRLNWSEHLPIELWQGVTIGGSLDRVTRLDLASSGLNGHIPPALGRLSELVSLALNHNRLTGLVPPELGKLTNLERLALSFNALSGPIPPELGKLSHLRELRLRNNRLTGSLSPELRSVADAETLCPAAPADNPGLRTDCDVLLATRDILAGEARLNWSEHLPIELWQGVTISGRPDRVTRLELASSGLNGRIPPALGRLSELVSLALNRNRLTGPVPPELAKLTNLERLVLSFNALSGPIPPELGKLSQLRELWLKHNRLSGPVPPELQGLKKLTLLRISGNDLAPPHPPRLFGIAESRIPASDFGLDEAHRHRPLGDAETAEAVRRTNWDRLGAVRRLFCSPSSGIASDLQADCALLLASRDVLAGDAPLNWSADTPIEFWQGVTVGGAPKRVTALELPRTGLNGRLFAELGELGGLVALNLSHNRLAGPIPPGLGGLEHLVSLRLEGNRLTGPVPPELEGLDNLVFLRLAGNNLYRPFPPALREVADHDLDTPAFCRPRKIDPGLLADCALLLRVKDALAGDAPLNWREEVPVDDWLGVAMDRSRGRVTALDLTQMGLNGRIPAELGQLAGLVSLRLGRNRLAGRIPPELGNLVGLRMLALDGNLLAGSVPSELGKLRRLTDLWLHGNRLIGPTPPSVAALPKLVVLRLDDDDAAGETPTQDRGRNGVLDRNLLCQPLLEAPSRLHDDCATLLGARDVLAGDVELNWSEAVPMDYWRGVTIGFPASVGDTAEGLRVIALDLSHMGLNGRIPPGLSALDALAVLRLGHNRLAGSIPPELGALSGLQTLNLESNALTSAIPKELDALEKLVSLRLGNNELTGRMRQFTTLTNLRVLALENTGLSGKIHWQIGNLWRLEELRLENNRLYGAIPKELDRLARLAVLRLGGNAFADCIQAASRTARTRHNDLDSADLLCESPPWAKPDLFEDGARLMRLRDILAGDAVLNWSYARPVSSWQGVFIGRSGRIGTLDLRDMNLTGRIPPELSELNHLYVLRLDRNRLTGSIPPELGNLTRLFMLSLDGNRLTGPIPPELANLSNLGAGGLWLADNRLTGSIPPALAGIWRLSLAVAGNDFRGCLPWEMQRLRSRDSGHGLICAALATDRPVLWRLGLEKAMEAPVLGHGFGALEYLDDAPTGHHGKPLGPHNLYLMLLGEAGIVPLLLFVSAIVLLLRAQWGAPKSLARDATVAWVIVIALYGMTFQHLLGIGAFMFLAGLSVAAGAAHHDGDRQVAMEA